MIIVTCHHGLANRLFYFAHCTTLGDATGHTVFSSMLPQAGQAFSGKHGAFCLWPATLSPRVRWPNWVRQIFNRVFWRLLNFWQKHPWPGVTIVDATCAETERFSTADPDFVRMLKSNRLIIMTGWIAIEKIVLPDPGAVRALFAPRKELADAARDFAQNARGQADILVGIHCRWGDYRHHGNGCFYYPIDAYLRVMRRCVELFPQQRVAFLVITNEPDILRQTMGLFEPLQATLGPGTTITDLLSLAECDYIVCPASSFSLWAAFLGRKPVWLMSGEEALPELKDFAIHEHTFKGMHPEPAVPSLDPT